MGNTAVPMLATDLQVKVASAIANNTEGDLSIETAYGLLNDIKTTLNNYFETQQDEFPNAELFIPIILLKMVFQDVVNCLDKAYAHIVVNSQIKSHSEMIQTYFNHPVQFDDYAVADGNSQS